MGGVRVSLVFCGGADLPKEELRLSAPAFQSLAVNDLCRIQTGEFVLGCYVDGPRTCLDLVDDVLRARKFFPVAVSCEV